MPPFFALIVCAAAFVFAAHFDIKHRYAACLCAVALMANLCWTNWVQQPFAPQFLLAHIGLHYKGVEMWALGDCLTGCLWLWVARDTKWGDYLWVMAFAQETLHFGLLNAGMDPDLYLWSLDAILLMQAAVFFGGGHKGVADRLYDIAGRLSLSGGQVSPQQGGKAQ